MFLNALNYNSSPMLCLHNIWFTLKSLLFLDIRGAAAKEEQEEVNGAFALGSAILPLGIYPHEIETYVHTKAWAWKFTALLLILVINSQELETTQHPSTGEWTHTRGIAIRWSTNTATQKQQTTDKHNIMGESRNHYIEWKRPDPKYFILYIIHFKIQISFEILE